MMEVQESTKGATFRVKVQPGAKRMAIAGEIDGALKVSLTAPPVDGKANRACIEFLAKLLKAPRSSVTIASGLTGRRKVIRVAGLTADDVRRRLAESLPREPQERA